MKQATNKRFPLIVFLVVALIFVLPSVATAKERQYRLTLLFSEPACKWTRVIIYRDDFHLFLDINPFPGIKDAIFVAGTVYPKNGTDHVSVTVGTSF